MYKIKVQAGEFYPRFPITKNDLSIKCTICGDRTEFRCAASSECICGYPVCSKTKCILEHQYLYHMNNYNFIRFLEELLNVPSPNKLKLFSGSIVYREKMIKKRFVIGAAVRYKDVCRYAIYEKEENKEEFVSKLHKLFDHNLLREGLYRSPVILNINHIIPTLENIMDNSLYEQIFSRDNLIKEIIDYENFW